MKPKPAAFCPSPILSSWCHNPTPKEINAAYLLRMPRNVFSLEPSLWGSSVVAWSTTVGGGVALGVTAADDAMVSLIKESVTRKKEIECAIGRIASRLMQNI